MSPAASYSTSPHRRARICGYPSLNEGLVVITEPYYSTLQPMCPRFFVMFAPSSAYRARMLFKRPIRIRPYARKTVPMIFQYGWKSMASLSPAAVRPTTKGARLCASFSTFRAVLLNSALDGMREPLYRLTCFVSLGLTLHR